jgi:hypothetical protein
MVGAGRFELPTPGPPEIKPNYEFTLMFRNLIRPRGVFGNNSGTLLVLKGALRCT